MFAATIVAYISILAIFHDDDFPSLFSHMHQERFANSHNGPYKYEILVECSCLSELSDDGAWNKKNKLLFRLQVSTKIQSNSASFAKKK